MHRLQISFDESTGKPVIRHYCTEEVAGVPVTHSEDIEMTNESNEIVAGVCKQILDGNRTEMEQRTKVHAIKHVAAVTGKTTKGQQSLKIEGVVGPIGVNTTNKG